MTNLIAGPQKSLLTRERLLFGGPLLVCTLLATGIGWFLMRPAQERVVALETRLAEIQSLERQLPLLDLELAKANAKLITAQRQQALLVDLIAGQDRIQTFLALLGRISRATGVDIKRYEPLDEPVSAEQPESSRQPEGEESSQIPLDPLVAMGYRKTVIALQVDGHYADLQQFLQQMERLELLVESSDLSLKSLKESNPAQQDVVLLPKTELSMRLSFYDRALNPRSPAPTRPTEQPLS